MESGGLQVLEEICVALTSGNTGKVLSSPEGEDEFYDVARQLYATPQ